MVLLNLFIWWCNEYFMVHEDVVRNPYMLYDQKYDDYVNMKQENAMEKYMKLITE